MSELPEDLVATVRARRKKKAEEEAAKNAPPVENPAVEEYNERVGRLEQWARVLGPLAVAKGVEYTTLVKASRKNFPAWLLNTELNDGVPEDSLDLSRSPSPPSTTVIWSGTFLNGKGSLFYFNNTANFRKISIDDIAHISRETIPYQGLESIDDVDLAAHGIEAVEAALAKFADDNNLIEN